MTADLSREGERQFRALLESMPGVAVQGYDGERRIIYWNKASTRLYGFAKNEVRGRKLEDVLIPESARKEVIRAHTAWLTDGVPIPASELELQHKSGHLVPVFSQHVMLSAESGEPVMFCIDIDLSCEKQAQRELDDMARYDALTHVLSRQAFEHELERKVAASWRHKEPLAVILLDLDRFAEINETQGYGQGDRLLQQIAQRLSRFIRDDDLLARFSSDEFLMAFSVNNIELDVLPLVQRIIDTLDHPFVVNGKTVNVTGGMGVSLFPENGDTAAELIRTADLAKNRAKQSGRNSCRFYNQSYHQDLMRQHEVAERLQHALREDEFELHYQPKIDVRSGRIHSLEALLRWRPAGGEMISPAEFIPIAERSNLIGRIGQWVLREACRQQACWHASGISGCRIDINLSGKQLDDDMVFRELNMLLNKHGLSPRDIGIELTENVLIEARTQTLAGLKALHHRGMSIAIDDFGTGYSSLSYLKLFPLSAIQIDRGFVSEAPASASDRAVMEATVLIGHRLGLEVVAEGVETAAQLEMVRSLGCDLAQGYYYYKPMDSTAATRLLSGSGKARAMG